MTRLKIVDERRAVGVITAIGILQHWDHALAGLPQFTLAAKVAARDDPQVRKSAIPKQGSHF
jgi:hypothetical protein